MNLLDGKIYDPAVAVSKATSALLALTALDTTNLRLTVTVPPSGKIYWRIKGALHGATTYPQIILGVLEGANVRARVAAMLGGNNLAATSICAAWAEGLITGLTPGAQFVADAAYGVETVVASTGFKYGGPNNTTGNDNFGGCVFELWDPQPIYTGSAAPTSTVHAKLDAIDDFIDTEIGALTTNLATANANIVTIDDFLDTEIADIRNRLPAALVGGRMDASVGAMAADVITAAALAADAGTEIGTAVWASTTRLLTGGTNIVLAKGTGVTGFNDLTAAQVNAECDTALADVGVTGTVTGRIDAAVSSRMASYVQPTGFLAASFPSDPADQSLIIAATDAVMARLGAPAGASVSADVAAVKADSGAVKAKTDSLTFTVAGKLDANVLVINGVTVGGVGTAGNPWGPV